MPSSSEKQHNFMSAVAHNSEFASKAGVPQSVGKEFVEADKGKSFDQGGDLNGLYGGNSGGLVAVYAPSQRGHRQAGLSGMDAVMDSCKVKK